MAVFNRAYTATQLAPVTGASTAARGRSATRAGTAPWRWAARLSGVSRWWREGAGGGCGARADGAVCFPGGSWGEVGELVNAEAGKVRLGGEEARAS